MLEFKRHILNPPLWPSVQVTKLPTKFFMFLRVPLTHLDRWLAFFTKIPRDYRCSQTKSSKAKPRDLTVSAQLNGQNIKALVDTGAAVGVIDKEVLQEVYKEQLLQLQTDNLGDVKTVSGEALPVLGMFTTALDIANGSYSCTFIVVQDLPSHLSQARDDRFYVQCKHQKR